MTLKKLLNAISDLAIKEKIINYSEAGADIYSLNVKTIKNYPVLFASPTGSHTVQENSTRYTITLYYLDRLLNDGENDINIMSTAIEELKNLINGIKFIDGVISVAYIESFVHQIGSNYAVRVASSDNLVQLSSFRTGVLRMSARELREEVDRAHKEMEQYLGQKK